MFDLDPATRDHIRSLLDDGWAWGRAGSWRLTHPDDPAVYARLDPRSGELYLSPK